jgi:hypothetical protein
MSTTNTPQTKPAEAPEFRFPDNETMKHAFKFSIVDDKPIMMDYWTASIKKDAMIGVRSNSEEKILVKSKEEYTSPIARIYKVKTEYIIVTENSIYIVDNGIPTRPVS